MGKYSKADKDAAYRLAEDPSTHPGEIEVLRGYKKYLLYKSNTPEGLPTLDNSFEGMKAAYGAFSIPGMMNAVKRLIDRAGEEDFMIDVYTEDEIREDPEKEDVKLFWFPAGYEETENGKSRLIGADRPFVLTIAGGAYTSVCNLAESFPTAAAMNRLGYNVFAINYRVNEADPDKITGPLFPKPLDDVAAALCYILDHMDDFGLKNKEYYVNGFSAGANLTVQWGLPSHGYAHYNLPSPKALMPIYPAVDNKPSLGDTDTASWFASIMFGHNYSQETLDEYDVPLSMTSGYPACYVLHALNDNVAPVRNSFDLRDALEKHHIPHLVEFVETAGHGFGDGAGTDAEGWPERALAFGEKC